MPCVLTSEAAGTLRMGFALNKEVREWRRCYKRRKSFPSNGSSGISVHDDYDLSLKQNNDGNFCVVVIVKLHPSKQNELYQY